MTAATPARSSAAATPPMPTRTMPTTSPIWTRGVLRLSTSPSWKSTAISATAPMMKDMA